MITLSASFHARVLRELHRAVGSEGTLVFYAGAMPEIVDDPAGGEADCCARADRGEQNWWGLWRGLRASVAGGRGLVAGERQWRAGRHAERRQWPNPALRSIPTTPIDISIPSPSTPFVQPDGILTPISFRFLFRLWNALSADVTAVRALEKDRATKTETAEIERQILAIEQRLAALEARAP